MPARCRPALTLRPLGRRFLRTPAFAHQADLRSTPLYNSVADHFNRLLAPAFGRTSDAAEPAACPTRPLVAFTGCARPSLLANPSQHVCIADTTAAGRDAPLATVPTPRGADGGSSSSARGARWAPDGRRLALLATTNGVLQPYVADVADGAAPAAPQPAAATELPGTAEALAWSPDGARLLVRVAERDADQAGALGSATAAGSQRAADDDPDGWLPAVHGRGAQRGWRSAWVVEAATGRAQRVGDAGTNVWEAAWMGAQQLAGVVSPAPDEDAWYGARLAALDLASGRWRTLHASAVQLGNPVAAPSGRVAAVIEAVASDRGGVAGRVLLVDAHGGRAPRALDLNDVDVTHLSWEREEQLSFIGLRRGHTVAGHFDVQSGAVAEQWDSALTCGPLLPEAAVTGDGRFAVVSEGWRQAPALCVVGGGRERVVCDFDHAGARWLRSRVGGVEHTSWGSGDGLQVDGYLCAPAAGRAGPPPLVLNVHGGPVWAFRNKWQLGSPVVALLVARGHAVLSPNPRGSVGRGNGFVRAALGDMGGRDARDLLYGVDAIKARGLADPARVGVMGVSYGGYMAALLPSLGPRFAAAVPIAAVTNWTSYHALSNIGRFDELFFNASPYDASGPYPARSPVMHARADHAPTMHVAGALDRCVPPSQAFEHHRALLDAGADSSLVVYPREGHGVRTFPAYLDFCSRVVGWFEHYMPPNSA